MGVIQDIPKFYTALAEWLAYVGFVLILPKRYGKGETAGLMAAFFVLLCDLLGRVLFAPFELPVGVVLSLVGGCCFIVLLFHRRGGKLHD